MVRSFTSCVRVECTRTECAADDTPESASYEHTLLRRNIQALFLRTGGDADAPLRLPDVYEAIYQACRAAVCAAGAGAAVQDTLALELERCVVLLGGELGRSPLEGVEWLESFAEACEWFLARVVSEPISHAMRRADGRCRRSCKVFWSILTVSTCSKTSNCTASGKRDTRPTHI
jgi:hypothetical protein